MLTEHIFTTKTDLSLALIYLPVLLILFSINTLYYMVYYLTGSKVSADKPDHSGNVLPFVSVIICTRNSLETLKPLLLQVMGQAYPHFECVVVDDGSEDGTSIWLETISKQYPRLKTLMLSSADKKIPGKKMALEAGIRASRGDMILLTDADCRLNSKEWISYMILTKNVMTNFVIGFSPLQATRTVASHMGSLESLLTAMQYGSWARLGHPYMGVGRNMAYSRDLVSGQSLFERHAEIPSGDDDLFVQDVQSQMRAEIRTNPDSIVFSDAPVTWSAWYLQKSRHVQTSLRYKARHQIFLALFAASHLLFYSCVIMGLIYGYGFWVISLCLLRWIILWLPYQKWARLINFGSGWKLYPIFDLFLNLYYIILFPGLFFKRKTW